MSDHHAGYGNVRHIFLLASKPEHPLAILTGQDWRVLRTTVVTVAFGTAGLSSDLLEMTHYVERVDHYAARLPMHPAVKGCVPDEVLGLCGVDHRPKEPLCGRCGGAGALGGWQGACPRCGGRPVV